MLDSIILVSNLFRYTKGYAINNKNFYRVTYITVFILLCLSILVFFVGKEYYFFMKELKELKKLKAQYHEYIGTLKKITAENLFLQEKKKRINFNESSQHFVPVNRSAAYLKKSALDFGKKKGLGWALSKLYEANDLVAYTKKTSTSSQTTKKRVAKKNKKELFRSKKLATVGYQAKKQTKLMWPLTGSSFTLSSPFGPRKKPNGTWGFHKGLDMAAPEGTPIKAAADGTVSEAGWAKGFGYTIVIIHNGTLKTRYAHLSKIAVPLGKHVKEGEYIGKVGNTGRVFSKYKGGGHHLHFEVHLYGKPVNPRYFLT
jgi:murein DD-endopeptidase MepM/ murein hydrolase activator NlpD